MNPTASDRAQLSEPEQSTGLRAAPMASRILVVDDNEANCESLMRRLKRHGFEVAISLDGESALKYLQTHPVDLVLLDVMMPGLSGIEVLERIRQQESPERLPVIMATAMDRSEDIVAALERGANDYVTKPLDFPVVLARVRTHLTLKKSFARILELEERLIAQNAELKRANHRLQDAAERTRLDLESAARVQETFLPTAPPQVAGWKFAWHFKPCDALAGDALNLFTLDDRHVALYVLDVSGHGVAASLLAVAATRLLSETDSNESIVMRSVNGVDQPSEPADVAASMARRFAWNEATTQFFTLFYAVLDLSTRELTYVSAGHPGAVWIAKKGPNRVLEGSGLPIGLGEAYQQDRVRLEPGDRLYFYSDGVTEAMNDEREQYGISRLSKTLHDKSALELGHTVSDLINTLNDWTGSRPLHDDVSIIAVEALTEEGSAADEKT